MISSHRTAVSQISDHTSLRDKFDVVMAHHTLYGIPEYERTSYLNALESGADLAFVVEIMLINVQKRLERIRKQANADLGV
jgi:hypothetical protein